MSKDVLLNVCKITCSQIGILPSELKQRSKVQHIVYARMIVSVICSRKFGVTQKAIGIHFNMNQSNINSYLKKIDAEIRFNAKFRNDYESILERVNKNKALQKENLRKPC
ncbi:hypothetical protein MKJ01_05525 [Chryseobacterium sp. SSA4.19]|uniref:hypothetical protein n=1 Tax=Chryseobacterium sp. SSA4.19 TaxID=2919915 RepID=UPI001F4F3F89|nr:hypothetical protein [Chryseobacterium sp. SSA4.19]MCJ8153221.1 hypothetical protein [Chryseobacterium sp. SSA4.19]